ncbi:MAG: HDOD domain-containing protein [Methylococcales bacterium]|nr:HDOD domain-containing protein [Methylococcales bacterium]
MSSKMNQLFTQVHNVPQVPKVVQILINQFNDPNVDMKDIARNVEKEQVISLKVLRLVNSAYFGLSKKVASIEKAVVVLGMGQLRTLVIASGIVSVAPKVDGFNIKQFWQDSFCTASYAKWLAVETRFGADADITFTVGLISDLGRILIHLGLPKEAEEIEQRVSDNHPRPFVEKMRLGFTSQEVSGELCKLWKFSDDLIIPVTRCGEPLLIEPVSKIACIVFIARYLSNCKRLNIGHDAILQGMPMDVIAQLGVPTGFFTERLATIMALESGLEGLLD